MSAAALSRASRVHAAASLLQTASRRHASAAYAHMKVKKNNWVEQNEILRENKFVNWNLDKKNIVAVTMLSVVVPVYFWYMVKDEMATREENTGKAVRERW